MIFNSMAIKYSSLFFLLLTLLSCNQLDLEEPIPGYIYIDSFIITESDLIGSSTSQSIKDVWITAGSEINRPYELPAMIPVLFDKKDSLNVFIEAGIYKDGMVNAHMIYPFYEAYNKKFHFTEGEIFNLRPEIKYKSTDDIEILIEEDFEGNEHPFEPYSDDIEDLEIITGVNVFEGNQSGALFVNHTRPNQYLISKEKFQFTDNNKAVFLELDYKSNTYLSFGSIVTITTDTYIHDRFITLKPTDGKWKKAYIHLSTNFSGLIQEEYQLLLASITEDGGAQNGEIYIDNLKLLRE